MELRQLKYFLAVADELHFRRAAERLHMSQPPLSHQIHLLEREMNVRLLERNRRRVELTAAGAAFRGEVRRILEELDAATDTAARIHSGIVGTLRASFVGSAMLSVVPDLVRHFHAERPSVYVRLREQSTEDQIRALRVGAIDIGFVPLPIDAADVTAELVLREKTVAALPAGHRLTQLKRVPLARLAKEPFVLFPRDQAPGLFDRLHDAVARAGREPLVIQTASETQTIVSLVAAGMGVSLVQASVQRLALSGVAYRPVVGAPSVELAALYSPHEVSPAARAFLEIARKFAQTSA